MRSERLLLVLKSYIGDAVMASPLLGALERQRADIDVLGAVRWRPCWRGQDGRFCPWRMRATRSRWCGRRWPWRKRRYGIAVLVNRSFRSALMARLSGIPLRIGHESEGRFLDAPDRLLRSRLRGEVLARSRPAARDRLGDARPSLRITDEEREQGKALVDRATVGIQPGARFPEKQIPFPPWPPSCGGSARRVSGW